jgi:hypothetical protein
MAKVRASDMLIYKQETQVCGVNGSELEDPKDFKECGVVQRSWPVYGG